MTYALHPFQQDDIARIDAALAARNKVLYVLPTGGGKTVVCSNIVERWAKAGKRSLVFTHRRGNLRQTSKKLFVDHGLIPIWFRRGPQFSDPSCEHSDAMGARDAD